MADEKKKPGIAKDTHKPWRIGSQKADMSSGRKLYSRKIQSDSTAQPAAKTGSQAEEKKKGIRKADVRRNTLDSDGIVSPLSGPNSVRPIGGDAGKQSRIRRSVADREKADDQDVGMDGQADDAQAIADFPEGQFLSEVEENKPWKDWDDIYGWPQKIFRQTGSGIPNQFEPISFEYDEVNQRVTVYLTPGKVEEVIAKTIVDAVIYHDVTYNGNPLTPHTKLVLAKGDSVGVLVNVLDDGTVDVTAGLEPQIFIDQGFSSDHWYPEDPSGPGAAGQFYFQILKFDLDDKDQPTYEYFHFGPIIMRNDFWRGENLGTGQEVFKEHLEDQWNWTFRKIDGRLDGDDPARQINVILDGDTIRVVGNSNSNKLDWIDEGASGPVDPNLDKLDWLDGLVVSPERRIILPVVVAGDGITVTKQPGTVRTYVVAADGGGAPGDGWWGTVVWQSGGGKCYGQMVFENGILKSVAETGSDDNCVPVDGTQGDPGHALFLIPGG